MYDVPGGLSVHCYFNFNSFSAHRLRILLLLFAFPLGAGSNPCQVYANTYNSYGGDRAGGALDS